MNQKQHLKCFLFFIGLFIGVACFLFIIDKVSERRINGIEQTLSNVQKKAEDDITKKTPLSTLSFEEAKKVALQHAKLQENEIHFTEVTFDQEDKEYEIDFVSDTMRYEYSIQSNDGRIVAWDNEIFLPAVSNLETTYLTQEKASSLAQQKAVNATLLYCRFDYEEHIPVYEGKLREGIITYEFTIDARSGAFLSWETE